MTIFGDILFWGLLVGLFIGFYFLFLWDIDGWLIKLFISPFILVLATICDALLFVILMTISYSDMKPLPETKKEIPIYSLGGSSEFSVHGEFSLGCGTINGTSTPSYRYYEVVDGKYRLNEIPAENFGIVYSDYTEPKIIIDATKEGAEPKLTWIFKDKEIHDIDKDKLTGTIYIPDGSIIQSYEIKL